MLQSRTDAMSAAAAAKAANHGPPVEGVLIRNRQIALLSFVLGAASGALMGLWSFDGPLAVPQWLGDYDDTPRRLARLGHIAFFGLGFLNLLLARELPSLGLDARRRAMAAACMNFGNLGLPLCLFLAAALAPAKYLLALPVSAVFVALALAAWGALARPRAEPGEKES